MGNARHYFLLPDAFQRCVQPLKLQLPLKYFAPGLFKQQISGIKFFEDLVKQGTGRLQLPSTATRPRARGDKQTRDTGDLCATSTPRAAARPGG